MAKQTFTVGQVLLASQLTSLQQTALGGGAASAKVASYTLVAADAGTAISMTNASATTITVNTGLFSAGDTVLLQNLGAGVCTVTAGSATVNTAGSLALAQYEAGVLYFVSASAAVLFDYTQTAAASPLTTKGDIYTRSASADARLAVGVTDGMVLTVDSAEATGLKYATPASGGLTLLSTTTLTSTTNSISITATGFVHLLIILKNITAASNNSTLFARFNSDTGNNYTYNQWRKYGSGSGDFQVLQNQSSWEVTNQLGTSGGQPSLSGSMDIWRATDTSNIAWELRQMNFNDSSQAGWYHTFGKYNASAAISNLTLIGSSNLGGTVFVFGVK